MNIDVKSDEDTTASDFGTMSFTLDGAVRTKALYNGFKAENLKLYINLVAGNVKVKKIMIWADPVTI